jgi:hypothetical protein
VHIDTRDSISVLRSRPTSHKILAEGTNRVIRVNDSDWNAHPFFCLSLSDIIFVVRRVFFFSSYIFPSFIAVLAVLAFCSFFLFFFFFFVFFISVCYVPGANFAFSIYDFEGNGTVDAYYVGDILRGLNLNPTLAVVEKVGGTKKKSK